MSCKLLEDLMLYQKFWKKFSSEDFGCQDPLIKDFVTFAQTYNNLFDRECSYGHITGSGFVLSEDFCYLLMTHHKKLDKWIQLGGHCDGHQCVFEVALKECMEESGLNCFTLFPFEDVLDLKIKTPLIFDLDRHLIPENQNEKEHFHFDVRYLFITDRSRNLKISSESKDLKWIPLDNILEYNSEESIKRPLKKIKKLKSFLKTPYTV